MDEPAAARQPRPRGDRHRRRRSGPGADRFVQVGDRVILGLGGSGGGYWCGACRFCLSGQPRHCAESKGIIGTFAEYFPVWARSLVKIPDSLGDHEAPLACGGLTAYGAVKKLLDHRVLPGRPVAIVGAAGRSRSLRGPARENLWLSGDRGRRRSGAAGLREVARRRSGARRRRPGGCRRAGAARVRGRRREPGLLGEDGRLPARLRSARPARACSSPSASPPRAKATSSGTRSSSS